MADEHAGLGEKVSFHAARSGGRKNGWVGTFVRRLGVLSKASDARKHACRIRTHGCQSAHFKKHWREVILWTDSARRVFEKCRFASTLLCSEMRKPLAACVSERAKSSRMSGALLRARWEEEPFKLGRMRGVKGEVFF